jgi:hypothetical protein
LEAGVEAAEAAVLFERMEEAGIGTVGVIILI